MMAPEAFADDTVASTWTSETRDSNAALVADRPRKHRLLSKEMIELT